MVERNRRNMAIPAELKYSMDHEWVRVEGNKATIGITDYAQEQLGDVVYVELPGEGDGVTAGDTFGVVESVKTASDLISPVSGAVTAANEALMDEPELVNSSPYDDAWMIAVEMSDPSELDELMDASAYEAFLTTLDA
jgi:glycine cleavage system H protein